MLVCANFVTAKDVFRYVDEETGQSHYMTGEPGTSVEGGWTFKNADGDFELTYKADDMGFQPQAKHLPIPVDDTVEVTEAKNKFYALFEEAKAKVAEAQEEPAFDVREESGIVDVRRKREAFHPKFMFKKPSKYTFDPYYGFVPVDAKKGEEMEEMEEKLYKFVPYKGFVAAEEAEAEEEMKEKPLFKYVPYRGFKPVKEGEEPEEGAKLYTFDPFYGYVPADKEMEAPLFKHHPYHGFVPVHKEMEEMEKPEFKFHPYYGYVPVKKEGEETEEVKEFKYIPYRGFVPADEMVEGEEEWKEKLSPYHMKMAERRFKHVPYYGFVPILEEKSAGKEKREAEEETKEEKENLILPPHPAMPYDFHPFLGLVPKTHNEDEEASVYKYVPFYGFVPFDEEKDNEDVTKYKYDPLYGFVQADQEIKPVEEQEYKYEPYVGFVPLTGEEEEDVKTYKFHPYYGFVENDMKAEGEEAEEKEAKLYKFVPFYGFVPVDKDMEEKEAEEKEAEEGDEAKKHHLVFHPYFGYIPTEVQKGPAPEEQLYKFDPLAGFVPVEKEEKEEKPGEDVKRKKRDAQFLYQPQYIPTLLYPSTPVVTYPVYQPVQTVTVQRVATEPKTSLPLPDSFPVIPHDSDNTKQGSFVF